MCVWGWVKIVISCRYITDIYCIYYILNILYIHYILYILYIQYTLRGVFFGEIGPLQLVGFMYVVYICYINSRVMRVIRIHTDGACSGNPGPGGWAFSIDYWGTRIVTDFGGYELTTNNRMELMAVIQALKAVGGHSEYQVIVFSDSKYVVDSVNKGWLQGWFNRGELTSRPNMDLWLELNRVMSLYKHLTFLWVKGHSNNAGNNVVDDLAVCAYGPGQRLSVDNGYFVSKQNVTDSAINAAELGVVKPKYTKVKNKRIVKGLKQLTKGEFEVLKAAGVLYDLYPDAPNSWAEIHKLDGNSKSYKARRSRQQKN